MMAVWLVVTAATASAQFGALATNGDGSELYFVTTLRLEGSTQAADPKLFRVRVGGRPEFLIAQSCNFIQRTGVCDITDLQVTTDGSAVVYQSKLPCTGGSSCELRELGVGTLLTRDGTVRRFSGRIRISRNGAYLVQHDTSGNPSSSERSRQLLDLRSGTAIGLPAALGIAKRATAVALDGTVLNEYGDLVRPDSVRTLPTGFLTVDMDDLTRYIVVTTAQHAFRIFEVASGRFFEPCPSDTTCYGARLSASGQLLMFVMPVAGRAQVFVSRPDGTEWRQITDFPEGVSAATLSGNGRVVWVTTGDGAIVRLEVAESVAVQTVVPSTRVITPPSSSYAPGSLYTLTGTRLAIEQVTAAGFPWPEELGGVRVWLGSVPVRLASVSPSRIVFQVPWELQPGQTQWLRIEPDNGVFDSSVPVSTRSVWGSPLGVLHEDFHGFVTAQDPARPGEVLHMYATGLGSVEQTIDSGTPAPLDRLLRLRVPIRLSFSDGRAAPEVLFQGLAPGLVGVYQIDFRMTGGSPGQPSLYGDNAFELASVPVT